MLEDNSNIDSHTSSWISCNDMMFQNLLFIHVCVVRSKPVYPLGKVAKLPKWSII